SVATAGAAAAALVRPAAGPARSAAALELLHAVLDLLALLGRERGEVVLPRLLALLGRHVLELRHVEGAGLLAHPGPLLVGLVRLRDDRVGPLAQLVDRRRRLLLGRREVGLRRAHRHGEEDFVALG